MFCKARKFFVGHPAGAGGSRAPLRLPCLKCCPFGALFTEQNGDINSTILCQPTGAAQLCPAENAEPCGPSASQGTTCAFREAQAAVLWPHSGR